MTPTVFTILYVADVRASAVFHSERLGLPILQEGPGFAMLGLRGGGMLGLWARGGVQPAPQGAAGAMELALSVADDAALHALHDGWQAAGVPILAGPMRMDFGQSFLAADPDGHRIRMFVPAT